MKKEKEVSIKINWKKSISIIVGLVIGTTITIWLIT